MPKAVANAASKSPAVPVSVRRDGPLPSKPQSAFGVHIVDNLEHHLEARRTAGREAAKRASRGDLPAVGGAPEDRILKFDAWVRNELRRRLVWSDRPADAEKVSRLIEQCRIELDQPVLEMWRRGWYLESHRLAGHIRKMLEAVGTAQRAGKVNDFWPYFRAAVRRYVGANAEEIQFEARSAGAHVGVVISALGIGRAPAETSLTELVAQRHDETLRARISAKRKQEQKRAADAAQINLL